MGELTLPELLARHPWPADWLAHGKPLDYLWRFDLEVGAEPLWPYLIDTSAFNRSLGLPQMTFVEKNGRLHGSSSSGIFRLEWEEEPWEWEFEKGLNSARIYRVGFARFVRARYLMEEIAPGRVRLYVWFGWIPRTVLGRWVLIPLSMKWLHGQYAKALAGIAAAIRRSEAPAPPPAPVVWAEEGRARLAALAGELEEKGLPGPLVDRLVQHLETADEQDLLRIRVKALARAWQVDERQLLHVFLHATRLGLLTLTWDVICPHCRGVRGEPLRLGNVPRRGNCEPCGIDFDATGLNALEVTFHVHPSIRIVEKRMFCAAEPATKPHIKMQERLTPGARTEVTTRLGPGRYRLRTLGSNDFDLLDVDAGAPTDRHEWWDRASGAQHVVRPHPTLAISNGSDRGRYFIVEECRIDRDALRPADLFCFQLFRDLFSEEAVAADVQLDVGVQTILFTDIVGSTRYYETAGDTVAFAKVWEHFTKAHDVIQGRRGVIVKTVGDAIMAAFRSPYDALVSAVDLLAYFGPSNPKAGLQLRATLHSGSCLAVDLDANVDYFGSTVNLTAKLQALAEAGQIVFTESVRSDPEVQRYLTDLQMKPEELEFQMKWSGNSMRVYRIQV